MRKFFALFILFPVCLCSCFSKKTNELIEGEFEGHILDDYGHFVESTSTFSLIVKEIDKDSFLKAEGLNVVEDATKKNSGHYYLFNFYEINADGETINHCFYNLHDDYPDTSGLPASYSDNYDNGFTRNTLKQSYNLTYNKILFFLEEIH